MSRRQRSHKPKVKPEDVNLGRFAGSSDEEEEDDESVPDIKEQLGVDHVDADDEGIASASESEAEEFPPMKKITEGGDGDGDEEEMDEPDSENEFTKGGKDGGGEEMEDADSENEFEDDPASKMANAMAKILGTAAPQQSVILGKTKTPLQRMQQKEKEEEHQMKEKRQANRERNLSALHIPLSVATTNTIENEGQLSVSQELEQERLHRRVATRGVVALFNAISQHQKGTREEDVVTTKRNEAPKLTKHDFLDKIKSAAAAKSGDKKGAEAKSPAAESKGKDAPQWNALKDDYMLDSKKNWDEESSDEGSSVGSDPENPKEKTEPEKSDKKRGGGGRGAGGGRGGGRGAGGGRGGGKRRKVSGRQ